MSMFGRLGMTSKGERVSENVYGRLGMSRKEGVGEGVLGITSQG